MYSFARKEFICKVCVPNRTIKMLVAANKMSVVCDECRQEASEIAVKVAVEKLADGGVESRPMSG